MGKEIIIKLKYIILTSVILSLLTGLISFYILKPEYQTYTTIMIGKPEKSEEGIDYSNVLLFKDLVTTYVEIAKSKIVANEVINNLNLDISYESLKDKTKITMIRETGIIKIVVNDKKPYKAVEIANEFPIVIKGHIESIMNIPNIEIIDEAEFPTKPIKPKPLLNMFISFILGIMISSFVLVYMDNFNFTKEKDENYKVPDKKNNEQKEKYLTIISIYKNKNTLIISSSTSCGRFLIEIVNNLSKLNRKILLIDSDLKNKTLSKYFKVEDEKGLINIINEKRNYKKVVRNSEIKNISLISLGCGSDFYFDNYNLRTLINNLSNEYDIIFIDSLPIGYIKLNQVYSDLIDLSCNESIRNLHERIIELMFNKST